MSIRYKSFTAIDYKTMAIGNEISCANLKEKIRKEEFLTDKNTNIILSFENARGKERINYHYFVWLIKFYL